MMRRSPSARTSGVTAVGSSRPASASNASATVAKRLNQAMVTIVGKIMVMVPSAASASAAEGAIHRVATNSTSSCRATCRGGAAVT